MANDKDKMDIDDIKDPEDLDIDEAVAEEEPVKDESKEEVVEGETVEETDEVEEVDDDKDVLEKETEEAKEKVKEKPQKPIKMKSIPGHRKSKNKFIIIAIIACLIAAALILGGVYYLNQRSQPEATTDTTEENQAEEEVTPTEEEVVEKKALYINSEVGLNLRQSPSPTAKVLAIIPFGYKITVLEEQDDWVKTTYSGKTGWVSVDYTQETNPLVYENDTYGFGLTFKSDWAGYKFIEADNEGSTTVKTYYVCLPTTDKNWNETSIGIPKGYASLFVMGVYTKAEWAKMAGGEIHPAKLGEGTKYVYTYLPGQAYASDLKTQYSSIKDIIDTFEVLN
jgi:uncharacterized protein YgiM (DUF1202 family)